MRPSREKKRPFYAESPDSDAADDTNGSPEPGMASTDAPRKRNRLFDESQQQQLQHQQQQLTYRPNNMSLVLPQQASTPPPAIPPFGVSALNLPSSHISPASLVSPPNSRIDRSHAPHVSVGGFPAEAASLVIPGNLTPNEFHRRANEMERELAYQRANPPALPKSDIPELPEKPPSEPWRRFPNNVTPEQRRAIEAENNRIATTNQRIERERNNQAAKKSRMKRLEALERTRRILNDRSAECDWWRLKAMSLGASVSEWDNLPDEIKMNMVDEIKDRVQAMDSLLEEDKRDQETRRRTARNKARAALKESREASLEISEF
ncbi:hypothetical protein QQX98_001765 [Neonectria punicea]|uniref:BZIP domain-containing protein n=1 Tax=Neonectria punicea TaxID=979145 RepID=A0ABR1HMM9_9HYPO